MTPAAAAAEIKNNIGHDYDLRFELSEFETEQEAENVELMTTAERQALNLRMAEYFNG